MHKQRLSPLVRFALSFQGELRLSPETLCTEHLYNQFLARRNEAEHRKNQQIRMLFVLDAIIAVLLLGKSITVPVIDIQLSDFPAALEIATAFSSTTFIYVAMALVNENAYDGIIRAFNMRRAGYGLLDADFLTLADIQSEILLKVYKSKLNDHGVDVYRSGPRFSATAKVIWFMILFTVGSIFLVHIVLSVASIAVTIRAYEIGWILSSYVAYVTLSTTSAALLYFVSFVRFEFLHDDLEVLRDSRIAGSYALPSASFSDLANRKSDTDSDDHDRHAP